jgi:prepilin-type N-terminal cleavage/methylation domain-containing protein
MTRRDSIRRQEAGFTLVEVLTAIVILVFGLIAVTNLLVVAGTSSQVANVGTTASAIASEQMEVLKALPFPPVPGGPVFAGPTLTAGGDVNNNVPGFFRDAGNDPRLRVPGGGTITVRWQVTRLQNQLFHIRVRAESPSGILLGRTRADFTSFRACTGPVVDPDPSRGCRNTVQGDDNPCCPSAP